MAITSALVLFAVIWFMVLFITLPMWLTTQADEGEVEPGTPAGAPARVDMRKRFRVVTLISVVVWAIIAGIIISGIISVCDIDWAGVMADRCEDGQIGKAIND